MNKSHSFSIYLLKQGYDASNALKEGHNLKNLVDASNLPLNASLFVLNNPSREPWWKGYFGINITLTQASQGALIFIPVGGRCFVLSFGHVFHNLNESSYEYDFGLRVTLNSVDPNKLKSTDILEPGAARRQRTQVPVDSDLTYFDFDHDSSILKSLTGKIKEEHKELFKHATGASNLVLSTAVGPDGLIALCEKLLVLYESDTFKTIFPDIQNIVPVRDPSLIAKLNEKLLEAFRNKSENLYLTVPELISYQANVWASFSGSGASLIYDDVYLDRYYDYLEQNGKSNEIGIDNLKNHWLLLTDAEGTPYEHYSLFKCLIFDTSLDQSSEVYHLCEGNWYKVETKYVTKLKGFLDPLCIDLMLPDYNHKSESDYNNAVANEIAMFICLDKTNISPEGQTQIEPCDLYTVAKEYAVFYHIKVSTMSAQLSHLFNQGTNSIELLKLDHQALENLKQLIQKKVEEGMLNTFIAPFDDKKYHIIFGIVTHKDKSKKSDNLPLFSRITLNRTMKELQLMDVQANFGFVSSISKGTGKKKQRKKKEAQQAYEQI